MIMIIAQREMSGKMMQSQETTLLRLSGQDTTPNP